MTIKQTISHHSTTADFTYLPVRLNTESALAASSMILLLKDELKVN